MAVSRRVAALCGSAGIALFALSGTALAEDKFAWSASLTGTSDYVFRGISQTDNDPTIQGSLGMTYGMFYAGGWASGLDFGDDAQLEVDWYAGITPTWGMFNFDFGVIWYTYPGYSLDNNEYLEYKTGVSTSFDKLSVGATAYWQPEFQGKEYAAYEGTLSYELPKTWLFTPTVGGLVGYYDVWNGFLPDSFTYWNAGLALAVDNLTFDFRYWDTDIDTADCGGYSANIHACDERFVFSTTLALP